jgi:hypothetical protein
LAFNRADAIDEELLHHPGEAIQRQQFCRIRLLLSAERLPAVGRGSDSQAGISKLRKTIAAGEKVRHGLGDDLLHHASVGHAGVGQRLVAAVVGKAELVVIEAKLMQQRGMQVLDADAILLCAVTRFVGGTEDAAALKTAAG